MKVIKKSNVFCLSEQYWFSHEGEAKVLNPFCDAVVLKSTVM
jgi:hypothetical protein